MKIYQLSQRPTRCEVPGRLIDGRGRSITYLRLAVTDRCNLRCRYCMPAGGIPFVPHDDILSYEELLRLAGIFYELGVRKIRLTGGEPFARKGLVDFIAALRKRTPYASLHLTTNGVTAAKCIRELKNLGVAGLNLSLDTLNRKRFFAISRRNQFDGVMQTFEQCLRCAMPVKINTVVLAGVNDDEIGDIAELARRHPVTVRFIEQMSFNGQGRSADTFTSNRILDVLREKFSGVRKQKHDAGTTALYAVPGFQGKIGIIAGFSRQFCSRCNKVRVTPHGILKNCLYDKGVLDLRDMLRAGHNDREISRAIVAMVQQRVKNGRVAENLAARHVKSSMAAIGG